MGRMLSVRYLSSIITIMTIIIMSVFTYINIIRVNRPLISGLVLVVSFTNRGLFGCAYRVHLRKVSNGPNREFIENNSDWV